MKKLLRKECIDMIGFMSDINLRMILRIYGDCGPDDVKDLTREELVNETIERINVMNSRILSNLKRQMSSTIEKKMRDL